MMLVVLIGGHLVLLILLFLHFDQNVGIEALVDKTGLPIFILWGAVVGALLLDLWSFISGKKNEENLRRR